MIRRTPRATRPDPRFPYTSLVRSEQVEVADQVLVGNADARAEAGNGVELVVTVDEVLKGDAGDKGDKVSVGTRRGSASCGLDPLPEPGRSEEHTSELQSLMRISYAVFCLKKKKHHEQARAYR